MSFKADLWSYLTVQPDIVALVGDRIYPRFAPASAVRPFMVYSRIASSSTHHLGTGSIEPTDGLMRDVIQFDIYGETESSANEVKEALQSVLNGAEFTSGETRVRRCFLSSEMDGFEPPSDGTNDAEYRETIEFIFWYFRSAPAMIEALLMEDGHPLLQEDGGILLLEAS